MVNSNKNVEKPINEPIEVLINKKNQETFKSMYEQKVQIDQTINSHLMLMLDTMEITDYQNKSVKFSEDFSKLIIQ